MIPPHRVHGYFHGFGVKRWLTRVGKYRLSLFNRDDSDTLIGSTI